MISQYSLYNFIAQQVQRIYTLQAMHIEPSVTHTQQLMLLKPILFSTDIIQLGMQPGDVERTYADTAKLEAAVNYKSQTEIEVGIQKFVEWYKKYHASKEQA